MISFRQLIAVACLSLAAGIVHSQSIVQVIPLPNTTYWNQGWGAFADSTHLYMSSGTTSTVFNRGHIYKLDFNGNVVDSVVTGLNSSQGLAWDGSHFWYIRGSGSTGRMYRVSTAGAIVDSIIPPSNLQYMGGACWVGTGLWVSNYFPNDAAGLYKYDVVTKTIIDTLPTIGQQPQGVAWDGQYLYYAMDLNSTEPNLNLIYVVDPVTRDTVRTIPMPEGPTTDSNPRGLAWDGNYLWLVAEPVGASSGRSLYKYDLSGSGTPDINLSTSLVNFGGVRIGQQSEIIVGLQNVGTASLTIDSVAVALSGNIASTLSTPVTIAAGASEPLPLTFTPVTYGPDSASVRIYSNDPDEGVKILPARGFGIQPAAYLSTPGSHAFGVRRVHSTNLWSLLIQNQGPTPLNISSASFTTPNFYVEQGSFPVSIDSLASVTVRLWFNPISAIPFIDTMWIASNASNGSLIGVALSGTGDSSATLLGTILWEGAVPDNPFTGFDDYQPTSIKQIADVNGDGVNDVIVSSGNYLVSCFNGGSSVTGDVLWSFNSGYNNNNTGSVPWEEALQIREDVDGDSISDVVFGCAGGNEHVYTISGRTGALIWAYGDSIVFSRGDIQAVRVDRDYNSDGVKDVLASASGTTTGGRHAAICLNGLTGVEIFYAPQPQGFTQDIVSTSSGGAISANNNGAPYVVNGFTNTGAPAWTYTAAGTAWNLREVPDLNNDAINDIIGLQGFSGGIFAITGNTGVQLWATNLGSSNNGRIVLMDDFNGNGFPDFVLSGPQSLFRIDAQTGGTIWSIPLASSYVRGVDRLEDVNGDSIPDIAIATQQPGKAMVLSGVNGSTLFEYVFGATISQRGDRAAVLASIDGNPSNEFIGGNREGRIICFSGGPSTTVGVNPPSTIPTEFTLTQNYPNPFNPTTTIQISMPSQADLTLTVFDVLGREVKSFAYERVPAGVHGIVWDGTNTAGTPVASGAYFYQARSGDRVLSKRMMLLK